MTYIRLKPNLKDSFSAEKAWRQSAAAGWRCTGCGQPMPDYQGEVDVVVEKIRRQSVVDCLWGFTGFCIASKTLIQILGSRVDEAFYIGQIHDAAHRPAPNHVTLRAKQSRVYVRGDEKSLRRICTVCHRLIYLATGRPYLCGDGLGAELLQDDFGHLLVHSGVFEATLKGRDLPRVDLTPLEVQSKSEDKLPVLTDELIEAVKKEAEQEMTTD